MHLRNGAFSWRLDEDLAECHVFRVEMLVASWSEHLLQHERMTKGRATLYGASLEPGGETGWTGCKTFYLRE